MRYEPAGTRRQRARTLPDRHRGVCRRNVLSAPSLRPGLIGSGGEGVRKCELRLRVRAWKPVAVRSSMPKSSASSSVSTTAA